jgi:hypothetical protein
MLYKISINQPFSGNFDLRAFIKLFIISSKKWKNFYESPVINNVQCNTCFRNFSIAPVFHIILTEEQKIGLHYFSAKNSIIYKCYSITELIILNLNIILLIYMAP